MKSLQASHNVALLMENEGNYLRVYYADGHYEIVNKSVHDLKRVQMKNLKYKAPVIWKETLLFPTQNQRDYACKWINLDYLMEQDPLYMQLLGTRGLKTKAQHMFQKYKQHYFQ